MKWIALNSQFNKQEEQALLRGIKFLARQGIAMHTEIEGNHKQQLLHGAMKLKSLAKGEQIYQPSNSE